MTTPDKPLCAMCQFALYPCPNKENHRAVVEDVPTYCAVCDKCLVCTFYESPIKGGPPPTEVAIGTGPHGETTQTIDGQDATAKEAWTALEREPCGPAVLVGEDSLSEDRLTEIRERVETVHAEREAAARADYKYADYDEWIRSEVGTAALKAYIEAPEPETPSIDPFEAILEAAFNAGREENRPQDVVSSET